MVQTPPQQERLDLQTPRGAADPDDASHPTKRRRLVAYKHSQLYSVGRDQITALMRVPRFGSYCTGSNDFWKNEFFDLAAQVARTCEKKTDVISKVWSVQGDAWLQTALNLQPRVERPNLKCVADVYDYKEAPSKTLVVDFSFNKVGGGCFGNGFVQEEQIVAQSADFAAFLKGHRATLGEDNACTYEGVYMDIWWDREQAAHKGSVDFDRVQKCPSNPFTIIAVDAPMMKWKNGYNTADLNILAKKTILIYEVARDLNAPVIFSGLLGCGAFRGHRPLTLLLHLLLQPHGCSSHLKFHHPIFEAFGDCAVSQLEQNMLSIADNMLEALRKKDVATLQDALKEILSWRLCTSNCDSDIHSPDRL